MDSSLLLLHAVTVRYGRTAALDGLDLKLSAGERVAVVGPSGSGKTTLLAVAAGLRRQMAGRVERLSGSRVGILLQDPVASLDPRWTVERIVEEPLVDLRPRSAPPHRRAAVVEALESVGLGGLDRARVASELSVGQCQRVALARALVARPGLLLADEPTSALDPSVAASVLRLLDRQLTATNAALLAVSHDLLSFAPLVQRVIVLDRGRVVEDGSPDRLLRAPKHPVTVRLVETAHRMVVG